jgi:acetyl-CoA acetyltransferase
MNKSVVIVGGKRTAIGGFMSAFKDISATHLGTLAAKAAL